LFYSISFLFIQLKQVSLSFQNTVLGHPAVRINYRKFGPKAPVTWQRLHCGHSCCGVVGWLIN